MGSNSANHENPGLSATDSPARIRVAFVHDWLTGMRGGEWMLQAMLSFFAEPKLYTLLADKSAVSPSLAQALVKTSFLQRIPGITRLYRHFLPVFPLAVRCLRVRDYDLVISSSHCAARGIRKAPSAVHFSYTYAPMRYIWDRYEDYFGKDRASLWVRIAARVLRPFLQAWDRSTAQPGRTDHLVGISHFIRQQMESAYGRSADVVYPFVALERFKITERQPGERYLMVGAFAPNKRVDLAIDAFNKLGLPLDVIGTGQDEARLRRCAGPSIRFLGAQSDEEIAAAYSRCRAFVFPGVEDFGITPLEALASGAPVIAYADGGALETLTPETALFFLEPTSESLALAIMDFEKNPLRFLPEACRRQAEQFTLERFKREWVSSLEATWVRAGKDIAQLRGAYAKI